jgi:hypothetical protein
MGLNLGLYTGYQTEAPHGLPQSFQAKAAPFQIFPVDKSSYRLNIESVVK